MQTSSFLGTAIVIITLALIFYSIGTWAERLQRVLKGWHIVFFLLGLIADTTGTGIMSAMVRDSGESNFWHAFTGLAAIILMAFHALWAIRTYWKGSEKAKQNFSRFSILVWAFWLIPYILGIFLGAAH